MRKKKSRLTPGAPAETAPADLTEVVASYAAQAEAAADLADVDTTHLDRPTANPQALAVLNAERDATARERIRLDYERERMEHTADHERLVDRIRSERRLVDATDARADRAVTEGLADADEAAAELAEVREFERGASPATATRRLVVAVRGWRKEEFAYAIAGSALSAAGVTALLLVAAPLPVWVAPLIAVALEIVLTVRVIRLIGQRAELAEQHKGQTLASDSAGAKALRFLTRQIVGLLAVSVGLNLVGLVFFHTSVLGVLGALGAGAAALASWSAWQASVAAAETVRSNVQAWQGGNWEQAREELRSRAAGVHIPTPEQGNEVVVSAREIDPEDIEQAEIERVRRILAGLADEQIALLADRGTDALALMLNPGPEGGTPLEPQGGTPLEPPAEQEEEVEPVDGRQAVLEAITDPVHGLGAHASNSEIGRRVGLSRTAVRKHRTALAEAGETVFPAHFEADQATE